MAQTSLQVAIAQQLQRSRKADLPTYVVGLVDAGLSFRDVATHLREVTGVPVSHPTVMRWVEGWKREEVAAA